MLLLNVCPWSNQWGSELQKKDKRRPTNSVESLEKSPLASNQNKFPLILILWKISRPPKSVLSSFQKHRRHLNLVYLVHYKKFLSYLSPFTIIPSMLPTPQSSVLKFASEYWEDNNNNIKLQKGKHIRWTTLTRTNLAFLKFRMMRLTRIKSKSNFISQE